MTRIRPWNLTRNVLIILQKVNKMRNAQNVKSRMKKLFETSYKLNSISLKELNFQVVTKENIQFETKLLYITKRLKSMLSFKQTFQHNFT